MPEYRKYNGFAFAGIGDGIDTLELVMGAREIDVSVSLPSRIEIENVFDVFERNLKGSLLPPLPKREIDKPDSPEPKVFIRHGRSRLWCELKDHLSDKHKIKVEAYETGARAGHTIRDILEDMINRSTFALLVLTGEDEQSDGSIRARQNVIHETGLFQGRLGFARAIVLLEDGVEAFSNIQGIQYIPFSKGNIKETFGEVVATICREFG